MYVIPLLVLFFLAVIAVAWSPLFAAIIAGVAVILFLFWVTARPRGAGGSLEPPPGSGRKHPGERAKGPWGNRRE